MKRISFILFPVVFLLAGHARTEYTPNNNNNVLKFTSHPISSCEVVFFQKSELYEQDSNDLDFHNFYTVLAVFQEKPVLKYLIRVPATSVFPLIRFLHSFLIDLPPPVLS